jgi:Family of unknown function (DUF5819)
VINRKFKIWAWVVAGLLAFHFLMTIIYSTDFFVLPRSVRAVSQAYTVPFFHQNWSMFAPDVPDHEYQLQYRYPENGQWSAWQEITESCGFDYRDRIEYVEQSLCSSLGADVARNLYFTEKIRHTDRIEEGTAYNKALFYVIKMHNTYRQPLLRDSIQIQLEFRFSPKPGELGEKVDVLPFTIYHFPKDHE